MIDIKIPSVGESVTSATIAQWHAKDGETVRKDQLLVTLETDKVAQELQADVSGILHIKRHVGDEVEIGAVIGNIDDESSMTVGEGAPAAPLATSLPVAMVEVVVTAPVVAPPVVPAVMESAPVRTGRETRKKLTPLRKKVATHLVNAQHTAAILSTFNECDMTEVMKLRKELQEDFVKQHGIKLGFMSFFIKATVDALRAVPQINARMEDGDLVEQHFFDIAVAIGTERGLVVPVLRDCETKSFAELELEILNFAARAKDGKLRLDELQGGSFTISNGGVYGSLLSTPILNPPQSGILGMHSIKERPMAVNGQVVIRPMMYLALSYDHRIVDGREAVLFLTRIKDGIENPARLLIGV